MTPLDSILIVDDEPAVRDVMARWLSDSGADIQTAANADEALAAVSANHCDLAVIDVRMAGQDGVRLKNELRRTHPHTAVVLATAYTDLLDQTGATTDIADLLVKPFARDRFFLAIDRGRQWRKQAIEDLRWHAQLSLEVRDRVDEICRTRGRRTDGARDDRRHAFAGRHGPRRSGEPPGRGHRGGARHR
jgi:DNA-binding NtrC family response regulator